MQSYMQDGNPCLEINKKAATIDDLSCFVYTLLLFYERLRISFRTFKSSDATFDTGFAYGNLIAVNLGFSISFIVCILHVKISF